MLIFDAHLDLAWNGVEWNRNLELPIAEIRQFEQHFTDIVPGDCTVTFEEMHRGQIKMCIATLLPRMHRKDKPLTFYQSREAAHGAALGQLGYYRALCAKGVMRELSTGDDVSEFAAKCVASNDGVNPGTSDPLESSAVASGGPIGFVLSMEGAPPILYPEQVQQWYDWGLRIVGPAHYGPNEYCHGTGCVGGLSDDGRRLLKEMDRVGMLLDATHLADQSFWEALELFHGPVLASHHNCRALVPGDRQLSDEQILALIDRHAVIGAAFDNWMLLPGWKKYVTSPDAVTLEHVADHIDHVCQLAGNARHSGIGTDLDGGFGREQSPGDLDTIADVQRLGEILDRRGYSTADIENILWKNFVDLLSRSLPNRLS